MRNLASKIKAASVRNNYSSIYALKYKTQGAKNWTYFLGHDDLPFLSGDVVSLASMVKELYAEGIHSGLGYFSTPATVTECRIVEIVTSYFPDEAEDPIVRSVVAGDHYSFCNPSA